MLKFSSSLRVQAKVNVSALIVVAMEERDNYAT